MSLPGILHRSQQDNASGSSLNIITTGSNQQNQSFRQNVLCGRPEFDPWVRKIDPLGKGMATHSSILAWEIPWTEEPAGLQSMGSQKSWT